MPEADAPAPGESTFTHHPGDPWDVETELNVGAVLHVELRPAGGYRWSLVECSDPAVAVISGSVHDDGTARAAVLALSVGRVHLSATTLHTGDRFRPPTRMWR